MFQEPITKHTYIHTHLQTLVRRWLTLCWSACLAGAANIRREIARSFQRQRKSARAYKRHWERARKWVKEWARQVGHCKVFSSRTSTRRGDSSLQIICRIIWEESNRRQDKSFVHEHKFLSSADSATWRGHAHLIFRVHVDKRSRTWSCVGKKNIRC